MQKYRNNNEKNHFLNTESLDIFYDDCLKNRERHLECTRMLDKAYLYDNYCYKSTIFSLDDGIDYSNIEKFLATNNMRHFEHFDTPFCATNGAVNKKNIFYDSFVLFFVLWIFLCLGIFVFLIFNNINVMQTNNIYYMSNLALFTALPIVCFVFKALPTRQKNKNCTEVVDMVCVDMFHLAKPDGGFNGSFKPFFYLKHNGLGYILYNDAFSSLERCNIGDVVSMKIDPNNPFEFTTADNPDSFLLWLFISIAAMFPIIIFVFDFFVV